MGRLFKDTYIHTVGWWKFHIGKTDYARSGRILILMVVSLQASGLHELQRADYESTGGP